MPYDIKEVIGFIVRHDHNANMVDMEDSDLTPLKIQKLLYYAQGHILGALGKPLFKEDFVAWQHGPVIKKIYESFKHLGKEIIGFEVGGTDEYNCSNLLKDRKSYEVLNNVMHYYNQYSPWKLRNMSHEESPWKHADTGMIISKDSIKEFFSQYWIQSRIKCFPAT